MIQAAERMSRAQANCPASDLLRLACSCQAKKHTKPACTLQGSLHYTPEHCLANGCFHVFWEKAMFQTGKRYLLRSPALAPKRFEKPSCRPDCMSLGTFGRPHETIRPEPDHPCTSSHCNHLLLQLAGFFLQNMPCKKRFSTWGLIHLVVKVTFFGGLPNGSPM